MRSITYKERYSNMEVPNIEDQRQAHIEKFSTDLAALLQEAIQNIPLSMIQKVVANHQVDLSNLYTQALLQQQFASLGQSAQEASKVVEGIYEPAPES
jgi:c-di-AMP phosphodiesterase-like protein